MSSPKARKFSAVLRKRLQEVGQATVASEMDVDISTISRAVSEGRLDQICAVITALGYKIVPEDFHCVKREELDHVMWWARKGMEAIKTAADLVYEDDE